MAWILGDTTLPRPHSFTRQQIEYSTKHDTLTGRTTKDFRSRKEGYRLLFKYLTQAEVVEILSEYAKNTLVNFSVSETNLTIASTPVHIEIQSRDYNTPGADFREDIELLLVEEV